MAGKLVIDTLENGTGDSVPVDDVVFGTAKAWVNFNGTGTVAIRDSYNVSSITDNGTGDYTVNFDTAMPNDDYAILYTSQNNDTGGVSGSYTMTAGSVDIAIRTDSGTAVDRSIVSVGTFASN